MKEKNENEMNKSLPSRKDPKKEPDAPTRPPPRNNFPVSPAAGFESSPKGRVHMWCSQQVPVAAHPGQLCAVMLRTPHSKFPLPMCAASAEKD